MGRVGIARPHPQGCSRRLQRLDRCAAKVHTSLLVVYWCHDCINIGWQEWSTAVLDGLEPERQTLGPGSTARSRSRCCISPIDLSCRAALYPVRGLDPKLPRNEPSPSRVVLLCEPPCRVHNASPATSGALTAVRFDSLLAWIFSWRAQHPNPRLSTVGPEFLR